MYFDTYIPVAKYPFCNMYVSMHQSSSSYVLVESFKNCKMPNVVVAYWHIWFPT